VTTSDTLMAKLEQIEGGVHLPCGCIELSYMGAYMVKN